MATPTPSSKPAPSAATPQPQPHLAAFSSPVPRSVPSPAAQRVQAGKSPFNASAHAPTIASTATAMNHPTGGSTGSATRALLGSSPAPAMLNLESPLPGLTPSFSNMGGLFSSVGMGLTGSGLSGIGGLSMAGPPTEEERRGRLENVVAQVKRRPGRISPDGVKRLAEMSGFDTMIDEKMNGTTYVLAARYVMLEIAFDTQKRVSTVQVDIPSSSTVLQEFSRSASAIVRDSLSIPSHLSTITATLDKFAQNLDKLTLLDKPNGIGSEQTFNCFEAISGIYVSLRKLYEHEKQVALSLLGSGRDLEKKAEAEVTCKRSGRPVMNGKNEIGLHLDYWAQRGHVHSKDKPHQGSTDADGDCDMDSSKQQDFSLEDYSKVFALSIECQGAGSDIYSPARISETWISDQVERPPNNPQSSFNPVIDWLDPPPTYQSNLHEEHSTSLAPDGSLSKLPNVRFVARLHPPLVLPWEAMLQILNSVGVPQETVISQCHETFFDAVLLQPTFQDAVRATSQAVAAHKDIRATKTVLVAGEAGSECLRHHINSLFIPKRDHGGLLQEIPFDHPRQLVQMLPILRQYAFLNTLLKGSFLEGPSPSFELEDNHLEKWTVDMTLSTIPGPKLAVVFPRAKSYAPSTLTSDKSMQGLLSGLLSNSASHDTTHSASASITIDILPNAEISILDQNLLPPSTTHADGVEKEQETEKQKNAISKFSRALVISGDIGIWTEWTSKWNSDTS